MLEESGKTQSLPEEKIPSRDRFTKELKKSGFKASAAQLKLLTKQLAEIDADLQKVSGEIMELLTELSGGKQ